MKANNRCYTYFTIVGDFDPVDIANRLGIEPCESWKKGDLRRNGSVYESSRWSCGRCDEYDADVGNQLRKTIADLRGKTQELAAIRKAFNANFYLEIVPELYVGEVNPCLAPPLDIIDFCHETRTEIDIDMYLYSK